MSRKSWWCILSGIFMFTLFAIASGRAVSLFADQKGPIRYENFERIKDGMTKAEVEALLGCSPGDYRTGKVRFVDLPPKSFHGLPRCNGLTPTFNMWEGDQGDIIVTFTRDNKVAGSTKYWRGVRLSPHEQFVILLTRWIR